MTQDRNNVVPFKAKPKPPPKPRRGPAPQSRSNGERAINWSRAPRFLAAVVILMLTLWLIGRLSDWVSGIGIG